MNIETADRLLQYRKQHNLSQEELAEKIGVSRQAVSKWERGEASPDTENLILLAELYGVSLDELLRGKKPEDNSGGEKKAEPDSGKTYHKTEKVSFKNGIHVDNDSDHIHINLKDGVNVSDSKGGKVHVGFDGIHVEESGSTRVYTDENGNVMVDDEIKNKGVGSRHKFWKDFPFWAIALGAFLAWGFSGICFGWALSWISFLSIPVYYSLIDAIFKKNPTHFAYPVLVVAGYILFGYFNICGGWAMGWIVFLTIPVYYFVCSFFNKN